MYRLMKSSWLPALVLAAFCPHLQADEHEEQIVQKLRLHPGSLVRNDKLPGNPIVNLNLAGFGIYDHQMADVASLSNLVELNLHGVALTEKGLQELPSLKKLERLNVHGLKITNDMLKHIAAIPTLKHLDIGYNRLEEGCMTHLVKLTNLETLNLEGAKIANASIAEIAKLKKLKSLSLYFCRDLSDFKELAALKELNRLDTQGTRLSDNALRPLLGLKLTDLAVGMCDCTNAIVKDVSQFKDLVKLSLTGRNITNEAMKDVALLTRLQFLDLSNTQVDANGYKHLAPLTKLNHLIFYQHQFLSDHALLTLAENDQLHAFFQAHGALGKRATKIDEITVMHLNSPYVTDRSLKAIAGCTNLEFLYVRNCKITAEGLRHLAGLKKLNNLQLDRKSFTNDVFKGLLDQKQLHATAQARVNGGPPAKFDEITSLNIVFTSITTDQMFHDSLAKLPNLKVLTLANGNINQTWLDRIKKTYPKLEVKHDQRYDNLMK